MKIKEELNTSDKKEIARIFKDEFEKKLKQKDLSDKVKDILIKNLGSDRDTKKEVANISQKVIENLYKLLWMRRSFWSDKLNEI
jgi:signal recognition particle GTPase